MRHVLVYLGNKGTWVRPIHQHYLHAQIDICLALSWTPDQIDLLMNFDYVYRGVCAKRVEIGSRHTGSKLYALHAAIEKGVMVHDDMLCVHDNDAFPMVYFDGPLVGNRMGFTLYPKRGFCLPQGGVLFFGPGTADILNFYVHAPGLDGNEEVRLLQTISCGRFRDRFQLVDTAFNIGVNQFGLRFALATLPPRMAHFHPEVPAWWSLFCKAENSFGSLIVPQVIQSLLIEHGLAPSEAAMAAYHLKSDVQGRWRNISRWVQKSFGGGHPL